MKKLALFALAAAAAFAVTAKDAKEPVGYLSVAQGNIAVGGDGFVVKAPNGTPLVDGNTVMVPTNGRATVVLNNGCSIPLAGNQHMKVDSTLACGQLQASVTQLMTPQRLAQVNVGNVDKTTLTQAQLAGYAATNTFIIVSGIAYTLVKNDDQTFSLQVSGR